MEWTNIKERMPDSEKERGWYVILIKGSQTPHCVYFSHRNWQSPWHMPEEWNEVTYYCRLDPIKDYLVPFLGTSRMD